MWQAIHPPALSYPPSHLYYPVNHHPISISLLFTLIFVLSSYPPCHPYYLPIHTLCIIPTPDIRITFLSILSVLSPPLTSALSSYSYSVLSSYPPRHPHYLPIHTLYYRPTHPVIRIIFLSILCINPLPTLPSVLSSYPYSVLSSYPTCHPYYLPIHTLYYPPTTLSSVLSSYPYSVLSSYPPCHPYYLPIHTLY